MVKSVFGKRLTYPGTWFYIEISMGLLARVQICSLDSLWVALFYQELYCNVVPQLRLSYAAVDRCLSLCTLGCQLMGMGLCVMELVGVCCGSCSVSILV